MTLLERIKATIFGEDTARRLGGDYSAEDRLAAGARGYPSDVSTPADDPVLADIAAAGVQPISKPAPIEEAQNPERWKPDDRD